MTIKAFLVIGILIESHTTVKDPLHDTKVIDSPGSTYSCTWTSWKKCNKWNKWNKWTVTEIEKELDNLTLKTKYVLSLVLSLKSRKLQWTELLKM